MDTVFKEKIERTLGEIREAGTFKEERIIVTPQGTTVKIAGGKELILFCANNYLGLANNPEIKEAAKNALDTHGYGMSSVRFICGTQDIHRELEHAVSKFLGTEDTILYTSCFDANGGLFEVLLGPEDAIISDALNHASIIDGIRLCKAKRYVYQNSDMAGLKAKLEEAQKAGAGTIMIATDGVFSMDGYIAKLPEICKLAQAYGALAMVDDSHATGFIGPTGRGTPEYHNVQKNIDIITGTFGKALGGASGGFTSGRKEIIALLRQRSRPYLFSNTLAPPIVAGTLKALSLLETSSVLLAKLSKNTAYFREKMAALGFSIPQSVHPICPVMLGDAKLAASVASDMLQEGIYVVSFSYPVVPQGKARIRIQISAAHTQKQLDKAIAAFEKIGKKYKVI